MANGELIDAREAMDALGIGESELQNLVARGDLRAFRSAGTMKFRRDDVVGLKSEKGTEPTIIIPAAGQRKPGQSGILSAVGAAPAGSGIKPAVSAPHGGGKPADATGEIVFDDIELMPTDDGLSTQQQTVVGSAIQTAVGENTVMDKSAAQTGEMTVVDNAAMDEAQVSTGPAQPVVGTASGRKPAPMVQAGGSRVGSGVAQPAVSRVRQPTVAMTARRTASVYEVKTSHPIMTTILVLNAGLCLFILSIFGVMVFKGHYDEAAGERIIPPYLKEFGVYESTYYGSLFGAAPGKTADPKPEGEYGGERAEPPAAPTE